MARINDSPGPGRIRFDFLAEHYLRADFGADAVRPKSANTISHVEHIVRAYLAPRFGNEIAEDIKPLDIDIRIRAIPFEDVAVIVAHRLYTEQEPPIEGVRRRPT